ncbi:large proline-rich protein bag6-like [Agrilus planipennis]|uniref:Large proline-rich protein bag6-like n=1 Tax=Agrilus planipennis TaxID=224129 RepID=A0A7F5RMG8_AGRPL|nr:large proline-rich protein bag6-like [Agrilus planipennis]
MIVFKFIVEAVSSELKFKIFKLLIGGGPSSTTASSTTSSVPGGLQGATFTIPGFHNNPNMEVFMEVTPESITIDSMETTFVGGGQANELLQNAFQGPPSDILNSIWHMAGQLVNRGAQSTQSNTPNPTSSSTSTTAPSAPPTEQIDSSTSESFGTQTTSNLGSSAATTQNSQARGNTQTNPTTATHTRSTSRPHVHLAQHAIQGFDPYLPCNSHHVVPWRRFQSSNARQDNATATASGQNLQSGGTGTDRDSGGTRIYPVNNTIMNILQGIVNSIHTIYGRQAQQQPQAQQQQRTTVNVAQATPLDNGVTGSVAQSAGDGVGQGATTDLNSLPLQLLQTFMPQLQNINLSDSNTSGPTIAELLQLSSVSEGENLFLDLINLLSRHLTVGDLIQSTNGRLEPWMRIRSSIRNFFLVRVMNGSCSSVAIDRGVNRILSEMQPLFNHLNALPTRDDIDLVRSAQSLFRARLPNIISLATSRSPNSLRMLVDQCLITAKQFGALILRASRNGQPGVEVVLDSIVSHHTRGIPREIQQWTLMTTRTQMRQFLSNLGVPDSVLQPYIVRKIDAVTSNVVAIAQKDQQGEAMQVDDVDRDDNSGGASGSTEITPSSVINLGDKENDGEPLPTVVLGSETWHNDVPADWVPIIARDAQRQRRQNSQAPFSDAYLSGMPSKRRKIVTAAKPRGSLSQVISESVRRAVTATGLASVAPLEVVAQGAGSDINIQSAYRELLRSNVRAGIRDNSDFTPERFPNATSYFNGPQ